MSRPDLAGSLRSADRPPGAANESFAGIYASHFPMAKINWAYFKICACIMVSGCVASHSKLQGRRDMNVALRLLHPSSNQSIAGRTRPSNHPGNKHFGFLPVPGISCTIHTRHLLLFPAAFRIPQGDEGHHTTRRKTSAPGRKIKDRY